MEKLTQITPHIHRLEVPFEDIYTTVFFIRTPVGTVLFDTATYASDADQYIAPALTELGYTPVYTVISHAHRDHKGGLPRTAELYPDTVIVGRSAKLREEFASNTVILPADGDTLADVLRIVAIPGHSGDALGVYDTRTKVLLTGDSLQVAGIFGSGKWGSNISSPAAHLAALEKLRGMDIETIFASHDYHPLGWRADGREAARRYIDGCADALDFIRRWCLDHPELDDEACAALYNAETGRPTLSARVIAGIRKELI